MLKFHYKVENVQKQLFILSKVKFFVICQVNLILIKNETLVLSELIVPLCRKLHHINFNSGLYRSLSNL